MSTMGATDPKLPMSWEDGNLKNGVSSMFSVRWAVINPQGKVKLKEREKENNEIYKRICMGVCVWCTWCMGVCTCMIWVRKEDFKIRNEKKYRNPVLYICRTYSQSKDPKLRSSPLHFSGGPCFHDRTHHLHTESYDSAPGTCTKKDLITATATEKAKRFLPIRLDTAGLNRQKNLD